MSKSKPRVRPIPVREPARVPREVPDKNRPLRSNHPGGHKPDGYGNGWKVQPGNGVILHTHSWGEP